MKFSELRDVRIRIRRPVLDAIFDECDRYENEETGGKILGTVAKGPALSLEVSAVIDAGPKAKRTHTSLFQDGHHQYRVFRKIEAFHPDIEHLGTWHTHHVNGYPHLSGGDLETYARTVNHTKHNTDFFYALLVVARTTPPQRYTIRHYILRRDDPAVYELAEDCVEVIDVPSVWVPERHGQAEVSSASSVGGRASTEPATPGGPDLDLAIDNRAIKMMYPGLQSFQSRAAGIVYWKGIISLGDGTNVNVVVAPSPDKEVEGYVAAVTGSSKEIFGAMQVEHARPWMATLELERTAFKSLVRRGHHDSGG